MRKPLILLGVLFLSTLAEAAHLKKMKEWVAHRTDIHSIVFDPKGKDIATAGTDWEVGIWDVKTTGKITTFNTSPARANALAFSPNGNFLAAVGDNGLISLWDRKNSWKQRLLKDPGPAGKYLLESLAFSPDGRKLAVGGIKERDISNHSKNRWRIVIWDVSSGSIESEIEGDRWHSVGILVFAPDGKSLAAAAGSTCVLIDVKTGKAKSFFQPSGASISGLSFSKDGGTLLETHWNGELYNFDLKTGAETSRAKVSNQLNHIGVHNSLLIAGDTDKRVVFIWDRGAGRTIASEKEAGLQTIAVSSQGNIVAAGGFRAPAPGGTVSLYSIEK